MRGEGRGGGGEGILLYTLMAPLRKSLPPILTLTTAGSPLASARSMAGRTWANTLEVFIKDKITLLHNRVSCQHRVNKIIRAFWCGRSGHFFIIRNVSINKKVSHWLGIVCGVTTAKGFKGESAH